MQLSELKINHKARIVAIKASGDTLYRQRLIAMGLLPGTELTVLRIAPLGDPIAILVRGSILGLRKHEASILQLEPIQEACS